MGIFVDGGEQLPDVREQGATVVVLYMCVISSQAHADDCELETNGHRRTHHLGFDQCQADSANVFSFLSPRLSSPTYRRL